MPVPGFLASFADKAQTALKDTPLAQHIPSSHTGTTGTDSGSTQKNTTQKNLTFGQIQHQFRQLQQNYTTTSPLQKIVTAEKGVKLDFESLERDARAQSKELYTWGQHEEPDVRDVSDRLGFLNYIVGSLSGTLAGKLDTARAPFKELRDKEATLTQRRNVRAGIQNQIGRLEHSQEKGSEKHIAELREQLAKAEKDDEPIEREHEILLRRALKESEQQKFQALREYGEKLAIVSQAADALVAILPSAPPSPDQPYTAKEETGTIRASLQHSLDQWKPGQVTLTVPAGANLDRSHSQSFGETHAEELKRINSAERQAVPASPPLRGSFEQGREPSLDAKSSTTPAREPSLETKPNTAPTPAPAPAPVSTQDLGSTSVPSATSAEESPAPVPVPNRDLSNPSTTTAKDSPVNPAVGDNEPAPTRSTSHSAAVSATSPGPVDTDSKVPSVTPNVAETGESSSAGAGEPKRYESAEEEKKRLEREEREKLLHGQTPRYGGSGTKEDTNEEGDTPPPYQDI